jgi:hypothetical protein
MPFVKIFLYKEYIMPLSVQLRNYIDTIVNRTMPTYFDAHDVINILITPPYDIEYNRCLQTYSTVESYHSQISRHIGRLPGITVIGKATSPNIHGKQTKCNKFMK